MGFEDFQHLSLNDSSKLHPQFQDPSADVTFSSTDGTLFSIHRKYLEINTSAFPGAEFTSPPGEITPLTETAEVLELLFGFVYPRRHPDLEELKVRFEVLKELAEAAEKYEVYAAVGVCKMQMRKFVDTNPLDVLSYATRHDYPQLIQEVVPHLARKPSLEIAELLPPRLVLPWIRYRSSWDALFDDEIHAISKMTVCTTNPSRRHIAFGMSMPSTEEPQACPSCILAIIHQLQDIKAIPTLKELDTALVEKKKQYSWQWIGGGKGRRCDISVCQFDFVLQRCIKKIEERKEEIVFMIR